MTNEDRKTPDSETPESDATEHEVVKAGDDAKAQDGDAGDAAGEPAPGEAAAEDPGGRRPSGSGGVAWLALFIALLAAAAAGYSIVEEWRSERNTAAESRDLADALQGLRDRVAGMQDSVDDLDSRLGRLDGIGERISGEVEGIGREIERLESRFEERLDLIDSLPARMRSLEDSMAALQGISTGAREAWLIAEAEYYMQLANAQLQLARNPALALLALEMADERVQQVSNPGLISVRRALADELAALEAMDKPDIEGATLTLASLARVVESLPLERAERGGQPGAVEPPEDAGGLERFWASVKGAFSGLVKVTPPDQADMPLLAPDAGMFLRTNLTLKLQVARLALLRGEQAVFEQSLDDARDWLREYFDTGSTQVSSALETIAEMRDNIVTIDPPDISESLRLLRQYRALAGSEQ